MEKQSVEEFMESALFLSNRLDDALLENAYEQAIIDHKAAAKSAIALHFALESEHFPRYTLQSKNAFTIEEEYSSRELSFFIIDESFTSPALFIAALMPALLAKNTVALIFKFEPSSDILLTCELLGLEYTFLFTEIKDIEKMLVDAKAHFPNFTCVLLGEDDSLLDTLYLNAIRYTCFDYVPQILAENGNTAFQIAYPNSPIYYSIAEIPKEIEVDIISKNFKFESELSYEYKLIDEGLSWFHEILFPLEFFLMCKKSYYFAE